MAGTSDAGDPSLAGYWPSPWPGEDGGPARRQAPHGVGGPSVMGIDRLSATFRLAPMCTMVVLREPGEVFLLRHEMPGQGDTTATVERIDPVTLEPIVSSPPLPAGPFWPGGIAAHANGSIYSVYGRWAHRLDPATLDPMAARELSRDRPYNSFVLMPDGALVTKDIDIDEERASALSVLDPESLEPLGAEVEIPEGSVGRLAADGRHVYVSGVTTLFRYLWDRDAGRLELDEEWRHTYRTSPDQSYAWDPCLAGGNLWVMDGGADPRRFGGTTFLGCGASAAPNRVIRVDLADADDHDAVEISGRPNGFQCNVMLFDPDRQVAVGFDAGNGVVSARRLVDGELEPLWSRELVHASHMVRWPDTGELLLGDHDDEHGDQLVIVDIETGDERGRASTGAPMQSALFPAVGWGRDVYHTSFAGVTRMSVEAG